MSRPPRGTSQISKRKSRGLTLIEVLISMMILGIALGGILPAVWSTVRWNYEIAERIKARALATEIYEEIVALPREKSSVDPRRIGSAEMPRAEFLSVMDYDSLNEAPPRDPLDHPIPGAEGFSRKVNLRLVDPEDLTREVTDEVDLIEVTVEISHGGETLHILRFHRSRR